MFRSNYDVGFGFPKSLLSKSDLYLQICVVLTLFSPGNCLGGHFHFHLLGNSIYSNPLSVENDSHVIEKPSGHRRSACSKKIDSVHERWWFIPGADLKTEGAYKSIGSWNPETKTLFRGLRPFPISTDYKLFRSNCIGWAIFLTQAAVVAEILDSNIYGFVLFKFKICSYRGQTDTRSVFWCD